MHFFIPLKKIPSATHQEKKITMRNGKPCVYEPPAVKETRALFRALLFQYRPDNPLKGPINLDTRWVYPSTKQHPRNTWKTTKPDTDNLVKMLKDVMTDLGFWKDDAQVATESISKFYSSPSGIFVSLYEMDDIGKG